MVREVQRRAQVAHGELDGHGLVLVGLIGVVGKGDVSHRGAGAGDEGRVLVIVVEAHDVALDPGLGAGVAEGDHGGAIVGRSLGAVALAAGGGSHGGVARAGSGAFAVELIGGGILDAGQAEILGQRALNGELLAEVFGMVSKVDGRADVAHGELHGHGLVLVGLVGVGGNGHVGNRGAGGGVHEGGVVVIVVETNDVALNPGGGAGIAEGDHLSDVVGVVFRAVAAFNRRIGVFDFNAFDLEGGGGAGVVDHGICAHFLGDFALHVEPFAKVFGVVHEVAIFGKGGALREGHEHDVVDGVVIHVVDHHQGIVHDEGLGGPDVAEGLDVGHFGGESADDEALDPAGGVAGGGDGGGFLDGVGVILRALVGGVADVHQAVGRVEDQLPVAVVIVQDADNVEFLGGQRRVPELGVAGGAHGQLRVAHVERLVLLGADGGLIVGAEFFAFHTGVGKLHVVDAHQAALPLLQFCGR